MLHRVPVVPIGLCSSCALQRLIRSGRGSEFSMCERGLRGEAGYAKYPRLPVTGCAGYARAAPPDRA